MFIDPFLLLMLLLMATLGFAAFLFLPSIIEIIKPRDRGPRRILKAPLQKMIRHISHSAYPSKPNSSDNSSALKDLEEILKKLGVKNRRIGKDTIRIFGDVTFPPNIEISDNLVVEGALTLSYRCVCSGSVKAKGNVLVGSHAIIRGNLISKRNVVIEDEAMIGGSVHAEGSVRLGEKGL